MHYVPITQVSQLLIASAILGALSVSTEPLGLVFLSKISMMLASGRKEDVRMYTTCLAHAAIDISVFLSFQILVFVDTLVRVWIGPSATNDMAVIRLVLIGVPFYLFYTALRSVIDAGSIRPRNAVNTIASLSALGLMVSLSPRMVPRTFLVHAVGLSLVVSLAVSCRLPHRLALSMQYASSGSNRSYPSVAHSLSAQLLWPAAVGSAFTDSRWWRWNCSWDRPFS